MIGNANEIMRLAVDRESSMRGFLITGDESFLAPYELGQARFQTEINSLMDMVSDNPPQVDRLKRIQAVQALWDNYAQQMIDLRRRNQAYEPEAASTRGKIAFDETRRLFSDFLDAELVLRRERAIATRNVMAVMVGIFLFFSVVVSLFLAWRGRRE